MDERQKEAAERALRKLELEELQRRIALRKRVSCIKDVSFFLLPYRVLYRMKQSNEEIPLSKFYPHRAARAETEEQINEALQREREQAGEVSDERMNEIRTSLESVDYTPENMKEYYFTCFLYGFNLDEFRSWDWTGERVSPDKEKELKLYYQRRQQDFIEHPEKYATPALKADDDMGRYSQKMQELLKLFDDLPDE